MKLAQKRREKKQKKKCDFKSQITNFILCYKMKGFHDFIMLIMWNIKRERQSTIYIYKIIKKQKTKYICATKNIMPEYDI